MPAPLDKTANQTLLANVAAFVLMVTCNFPATDQHLKEIMVKQWEDEICVAIINYCSTGQPDINTILSPLNPYCPYWDEFNIDHNGLLLCGQLIVIPSTLHLQVLEQLHLGHQGITKCCQWAKQSVWWPGWAHSLPSMSGAVQLVLKTRHNMRNHSYQLNYRFALAENCSWFLWVQIKNLVVSSWLLLQVHQAGTSVHNDIIKIIRHLL